MTFNETIPPDIHNRLIYFQNKVLSHFAFLHTYGYVLEAMETGRDKKYFNYYSQFKFIKEKTTINISYLTDIINGRKCASPQETQLPVIDNLVSSYIADANAFMSIHQFAEMTTTLPKDTFYIAIDVTDIMYEITRVVRNYSQFIQNNLIAVLKQEMIYNCYTGREYDKILKEIHYR